MWRAAQRRPSAAGAATSAAPDPLLPPSGRSHHSTRCCSSGLHCRARTMTRPSLLGIPTWCPRFPSES
eukprot:743446-Prymnesium_polylepis.1